MSKRGTNIYKRKDGRWEGRYVKTHGESGKIYYGYVYARSYTEVKKKLLEYQGTVQNTSLCKYQKDITYETILKLWLQSMRLQVKESSYSHYYLLVTKHIIPLLGGYSLSSISTQLVEEKVEQMLYHGRLDGKGGLSPKTVTDIIAIIKSSIAYASYHGYAISCNLHRLSVKRKEKEMRVLSQQEQKRLLEVLMQDTDLYKLGVLLSLYTGIRIGELCGLQWKHIHLSKGILEIRQTMQRLSNVSEQGGERTRIIITEPKSQSSCRDIPLPRFLIEMLKNYQSEPQAYFLTGKRSNM